MRLRTLGLLAFGLSVLPAQAHAPLPPDPYEDPYNPGYPMP